MGNNDLRERAASENELLDILSKGERDAAAFPYENYIIIGDSGEIDKIINTGGLINIEVEDITGTLSETSVNYVTTGYAEGTNRFSDAFKNALEKLPVAVDRISNLLINIWMPRGVQPSLKERDSIPDLIKNMPHDICICWGVAYDESLGDQQIKVTLIAANKPQR